MQKNKQTKKAIKVKKQQHTNTNLLVNYKYKDMLLKIYKQN